MVSVMQRAGATTSGRAGAGDARRRGALRGRARVDAKLASASAVRGAGARTRRARRAGRRAGRRSRARFADLASGARGVRPAGGRGDRERALRGERRATGGAAGAGPRRRLGRGFAHRPRRRVRRGAHGALFGGVAGCHDAAVGWVDVRGRCPWAGGCWSAAHERIRRARAERDGERLRDDRRGDGHGARAQLAVAEHPRAPRRLGRAVRRPRPDGGAGGAHSRAPGRDARVGAGGDGARAAARRRVHSQRSLPGRIAPARPDARRGDRAGRRDGRLRGRARAPRGRGRNEPGQHAAGRDGARAGGIDHSAGAVGGRGPAATR